MLTPSAEIAAALLERIESGHVLAGRQVWATPRIRDFSGWIRQQYERRHFHDPGAARLLSEIEERQIWRSVIADSAIARDFSDIGGAARSARRAKRAIHQYRIPLSELDSHRGVEAEALQQWIQAFSEQCRALNAISGDEILDALGAPDEAPVWIDGPDWHPSALQWLKRHAGQGLAAQPAPPVQGLPEAATQVRVHGSPAAELADCADWVRRQREVDLHFRAWILIPDLATRRAEVADAFDSALVPARFGLRDHVSMPAYAIAGGTPLADHEPVRIALEVLGCVFDELPFARFSALLRAPSLQAGVGDAARAARLDEVLRSRAPSDAILGHWLTLCRKAGASKEIAATSAVDRLQRVADVMSGGDSARMLSRWAPVWIEALESGPWVDRAAWSSAAYQAAERFRELLAALACSDRVYGPLSARDAVRALKSAARETTFQAQTGVPPVWITGQAHDPWLTYDGVWIHKAGADEWPPPPRPLALLPVQVQRQYGVPGSSAALQSQRAIELQRCWTHRATQVVFSCSSREGLAGVPSGLLPPRSTTDDLCAPAPDPLLHRIRAQRAPMERYTDVQGPMLSQTERSGGTSSLRHQSLCAFRGFANTRLRADRLECPDPGFNALERGILLHAALEGIWQDLGGSEGLANCPAEQLSAVIGSRVDAAILAAVARRNPGAQWAAREARRLKRLLPVWLSLEATRPAFSVAALEQERHVVLGGVDFQVRIDRIDRLADGSRVLLDYKSGEVQADWTGERPDNPQLPIYALSEDGPVAAVAYAQVQARDCRFLGLSDRDDALPRVNSRRAEAGGTLSAELVLWGGRLQRIAEELRGGQADVAPTPTACRSCHLQGLCRIGSDGDTADAD